MGRGSPGGMSIIRNGNVALLNLKLLMSPCHFRPVCTMNDIQVLGNEASTATQEIR